MLALQAKVQTKSSLIKCMCK